MKNNPEILFFDDFTAPSLDRTIWNVETTDQIYNHEQQAYIDSPETIFLSQTEPDCGGALILQARHRPGFVTPQGARFDFVSGRINTREKVTFRYGRVSARLKLPLFPGAWPAFWALGGGGAWPACGEVDILEAVGEPDWVSAAAHGPNYSGEAGLVNKKYFLPPHSPADWHIYTATCAPDSLTFFVDDELIYRITRPMATFFGDWAFDTEKFLILNLALGGTYPFKTNGASQPYYGLSAQSVQAIQTNQVRFVIDWVKIAAL
ncbi:MAG: hypothetical protein CO094_04380 [Anaerolineae bacterium CG_4_9_14_3_um_filter_57_17]|nr:glycoside hydrolase family 16 protein [bacterium]NCT21812.1 glycoside hydrolase family 16 protein [bacterium]OIO83841.1 MAG: hypothetical protein AUK01_11445 [Anaerolineae bacterium CG2_30_57_67]PJB67343.1 MAG: hypothetical protein CO094_04380 [Anaerolineae bacterium CG_4_9_14_3_um_filter_57_17]